ncbi:MAG: flavin reductase [Deltaproteobacteria bacterium]|nr:flavin reductase [Deltaproteobacteria bacterium]
MAKEVDFCGIYSGKKKDKSGIFETFDGFRKDVPLVRACPVNLECRVMQIVGVGSHELVIGKIVESYVNEDCITDGIPDPMRIDPLIYSPKTQTYHKLGESVAKAFHIGKIAKG